MNIADQTPYSESLVALIRNPWLGLSTIATLIFAGGLIGYTVSYFQGINSIGLSPAEVSQLQNSLQSTQSKLTQVSEANQALVIERDTTLTLLTNLNKKNSQQQDDITAERNLLKQLRQATIKAGGIPLSINQLAIKPLPENAYEYRLDLFQVTDLPFTARGTAEITLVGEGKTLVVPMTKSAFAVKQTDTLQGRFSLPRGFKPDYVDVHIVAGSRNFERRYQWRLGEVVDNMPNLLMQYDQMFGDADSDTDGQKEDSPPKDNATNPATVNATAQTTAAN